MSVAVEAKRKRRTKREMEAEAEAGLDKETKLAAADWLVKHNRCATQSQAANLLTRLTKRGLSFDEARLVIANDSKYYGLSAAELAQTMATERARLKALAERQRKFVENHEHDLLPPQPKPKRKPEPAELEVGKVDVVAVKWHDYANAVVCGGNGCSFSQQIADTNTAAKTSPMSATRAVEVSQRAEAKRQLEGAPKPELGTSARKPTNARMREAAEHLRVRYAEKIARCRQLEATAYAIKEANPKRHDRLLAEAEKVLKEAERLEAEFAEGETGASYGAVKRAQELELARDHADLFDAD